VLSAFVTVVINAVAAVALVHAQRTVRVEQPDKETWFFALSGLLMLGLNGMVLTGDLFNLYVFLEISSLAGYALLGVGSKAAAFSAFRYLIIGTVGGSFYLLGIGYLFTVTGSLNLLDVAAILPTVSGNGAVQVGLILMVLGIAVKAALFPLHGWLPDAYTHASSSAVSLIAPIGTKVAAYVLARILFYVAGVEMMDVRLPITLLLGVLASAGIIYGSIMAIAQHELKRMLAYSSVAQLGYILLGFSLANPMGYAGAMLHLLNHAVMKGCLFLVAGNLRLIEGHSDIRRFDDRLQYRHPATMVAFTLAALSMIGLPPLAGFFSKWYLVLGTVAANNWPFLAVILVSSLLNAVYFFRILEKVYLRRPQAESAGHEQHAAADSGADTRAPAACVRSAGSMLLTLPTVTLGLALLVLGLFNAAIVNLLLRHLPPGF
jgi:multicomponent Na+:H+ antiporter subunit D